MQAASSCCPSESQALGALHKFGEQSSGWRSGRGFALRQQLPRRREWAEKEGPWQGWWCPGH